MRKAGPLIALTAVLAVVAALGAGPAGATGVSTIDYSTLTTAQKTAMKQTLLTWDTTPVGTGTAADLGIGFGEAEAAAGLAPSLVTGATALATIPLAGYVGWKIGSAIYKKFVAPDTTPLNVLVTGGSWVRIDLSTFGLGTVYELQADTTSGIAPQYCDAGAANSGNCSPSSFYASANLRNYMSAVPGSTFAHVNGSDTTHSWYIKYRTQADMQASISVTDSNATEYGGFAPANKVDSGTFSRPTTTASVTDTQLQNALAAINAGTGSAQSAGESALVEKLRSDAGMTTAATPNCVGLSQSSCTALFVAAGFTSSPAYTATSFSGADVTKPAGAVVTQPVAASTSEPLGFTWPNFAVNPAAADMPFTLPRPDPNETYAAYIARITALGYLGTATRVDLDEASEDLQVGPTAVSRITTKLNATAVTSTLLVAAPSTWSTPVKVRASEPVTLAVNPPTATPRSSDSWASDGTAPPPVGGTGGGSCSCPPLDLTPITGVSVGSKFPFGVFTWITHALSIFDVTAITPGLSFPVEPGTTSVHSFGVQHFVFDLSFFDEYMGWMRDLLTFFMWAAAIWFVAAKFLRVDWAGQPSDGTDELL
jgi:hypothetical protein